MCDQAMADKRQSGLLKIVYCAISRVVNGCARFHENEPARIVNQSTGCLTFRHIKFDSIFFFCARRGIGQLKQDIIYSYRHHEIHSDPKVEDSKITTGDSKSNHPGRYYS